MHQQAYFLSLKNLLAKEKQADLEQYNALITNASFKEKVSKGLCWEPLVVKETGYGLGDYPFVVVERVKNKEVYHQFSAGKPVNLYLAGGEADEKTKGTIHFVSGNTMKVILSANDLPYWLSSGRIGVQLLFDDKSYEEMDNTMDFLSQKEHPLAGKLIDFINGTKPQSISKATEFNAAPKLNHSQNEAVSAILNNQDICIVHGPPGTGKTTTLVEAITQLSKFEKRILVCAPSNAAADLLTEKLADQNLNVIRIGNLSRIDQAIVSHTVDFKLAESDSIKLIKQIKKQGDEYRRMALKYNSKFGKEERVQRNLLLKEAKNCIKDAVDLENTAIELMLEKAQVITCTLVGANHRHIEKLKFETVIIDEAAQALEPATWIPIIKAQKIVLAGDPFQLPPTVKSDEARKNGLELTLIEKGLKHLQNVNLLKVQYRMNEQIMGYSNQYFYNGKLEADALVKNHSLEINNENSQAVELIDTAGCGFEEKLREETRSYFNPEEWQILQRHLENILENAQKGISIGIISPYKEQVEFIRTNIASNWMAEHNITINTIDSFQGQERDLIYISLVRSNAKSEIGFLKDYRRMNVAMTRAKKKLVVIGDSATFGSDKFYGNFLKYCESIDAYKSAWEWI
ncbi:MAG: IGHMBP2 family helicase [Cytophagales bacterium]